MIIAVDFLTKFDNYIEKDSYSIVENKQFVNISSLIFNDNSISSTKSSFMTTLDTLLNRLHYAKLCFETEGYYKDIVITYDDGTFDYICYNGMM